LYNKIYKSVILKKRENGKFVLFAQIKNKSVVAYNKQINWGFSKI